MSGSNGARTAGGCSIQTAPVIAPGATQTGETDACAASGGYEYWRIDLTLGETLTIAFQRVPTHNCCGGVRVLAPDVQTVGATPLCGPPGGLFPTELVCLIPESGRYTLAFNDLGYSFTPSVQSVAPQAGRAPGACSIDSAPTVPLGVTEFGETKLCASTGGYQYWKLDFSAGERLTVAFQRAPGHGCCGSVQVLAPGVQTVGATPVCGPPAGLSPTELDCSIPKSGRYTLAFNDLAFRFTPTVLIGTSRNNGSRAPSIDVGVAPQAPATSTETLSTSEETSLSVAVSGDGVVDQGGGRTAARPSTATANVACGLNEFFCYARLQPGQRVTLRAHPSSNYVFARWLGACAGQGATCTVVASGLETVSAVFAPRAGGSGVATEVLEPRFTVHWTASVGRGALVVQGAVSRRARLALQVRRPGGGPFIFKSLLATGRFTQRFSLPKQLPSRAKLFPGGFVVSATGTASGSRLPLELRTIVLPSPPEGVVRTALASGTPHGPAVHLFRRGTSKVWARFRFATQPLTKLEALTVTWYWPNGRKIGTVEKANRPEVDSFLSFAPGLPRGRWLAVLAAGGRIVKRLAVRIR